MTREHKVKGFSRSRKEPEWMESIRQHTAPKAEIDEPIESKVDFSYSEDEILVKPINKAIHDRTIQDYFKNINEHDPTITTWFDAGLFIQVPSETEITKPTKISITADKGIIKHIISTGHSSSSTIYLDQTIRGEIYQEIIVEMQKFSHLLLIQTIQGTGKLNQKIHFTITHHASAEIQTLMKTSGTNQHTINLEGEGAEIKHTGVALSNTQINTEVKHKSPNTKSFVEIRGIVPINGEQKLTGEVTVLKEATNSVTDLREHALLLYPNSHAETKPSLEVQPNEVEAKHSASVSEPDEEQTFYLISRGINIVQAKELLSKAFLGSITKNMHSLLTSIL